MNMRMFFLLISIREILRLLLPIYCRQVESEHHLLFKEEKHTHRATDVSQQGRTVEGGRVGAENVTSQQMPFVLLIVE